MMNKYIRKITLLSISMFTLVLTALAFTYSWLSVNISTYVTDLNLNVGVGQGLKISIDGTNFTDVISEIDIKKAIIAKKENLTFNSNGYLEDKNGKRVDYSNSQIEKLYNQILLKPVTTSDAQTFYRDKSNLIEITARDGIYAEFDLYFKCIDQLEDGQTEIPVLFQTNNYQYNSDGSKVKKTSITSEPFKTSSDPTNVAYLFDKLTTYNKKGDPIDISSGSMELSLNAANAVRFSTTTEENTKIYEPSIGLGSYASDLESTKYEDSMYFEASSLDSSKNASFTYVNNMQKESNQLNALSIDKVPDTIKSFDYFEASKLLSFKAYGEVKKATFKIWIEGWDADCFDAIIGKQINVSLSFTTNRSGLYERLKKVNYHNGDEIVTRNYYDIGTSQNYYLPYNKNGKSFKGWYTDTTYKTLFRLSSIESSIETEFNAYALWQ